MKILHTVESYFPLHHGMSEVVAQISKRLVAMGHELTIATSAHLDRPTDTVMDGIRVLSFNVSGSMALAYKGDSVSYQKFLRESDFDVITNFAAQQWATDLCLEILPELKAKKVFVPTGFSRLTWPQYANYFARMPNYFSQYDANVFLSNDYRDRNLARAHNLHNVTVIPNGAAQDEFYSPTVIEPAQIRAQLKIAADVFLVLLVGSHTGLKGHREAIEIYELTQLKNATLVIVGNSLSNQGCLASCTQAARKSKSDIRVLDLDRTQTVALYHAADLFLFPSNIECSPIVLFECMASRTAFLSSDAGNAREIVAWSNGGKILPTARSADGLLNVNIEESANMLRELAENTQAREELAHAGFEAWRANFTWEKISEQYIQLYTELVQESKFTQTELTQQVTQPLISVVMPVYNAAPYLAQAIISILNQTVSNFEFIIIDDGSTDTSWEIIQEYAQHDARIKALRNEKNLQIAATLNKGFAIARGKYIARMDADDIALPARLALQLNALEADNGLAICGGARVLDDGSVDKITEKPAAIKVNMLFANSLYHPTLMVRRDLIQKLAEPYQHEYVPAEDYALWANLIFKQNYAAANLDKVVLVYRTHAAQDRSKYLEKQNTQTRRIQKEILVSLGLALSESEQEIWRIIVEAKRLPTRVTFVAAKKLVQKILLWNKTSYTFDADILYFQLKLRLLKIYRAPVLLLDCKFLFLVAKPYLKKIKNKLRGLK